MNNLVFKSDGTYQKMWLDDKEKALLAFVAYLKDKEHGLGNTEHLDNILMCPYTSKTIEYLLKKVNNDLKAQTFLVKVG